jgi:hypothetical protein
MSLIFCVDEKHFISCPHRPIISELKELIDQLGVDFVLMLDSEKVPFHVDAFKV